ncbi:L-rhamnose/proton symporter RhaT [Halalkalibaculum sp. DA3122]|uniref:L-rhamnose/proton symporter RhaT n=1 Tax=Halalkalibaculum sp. DA3122 TaxID=3373607 RepID=UPI003754C28C
MNPILGVLLHAVGGFAAGSFYLPLKKIKSWAWESYWLVNGFISWIIMPWLVAWLTVPELVDLLAGAPQSSMIWSYFYGVLWGIGGLTFGLTMRYLGLSLGYAMALGLTAMFGTIIPPIYFGNFVEMLVQSSGQVTIAGIIVTLGGIALTGWAGFRKDQEVSEDEKRAGVKEFDLAKGIWVAVLAGIMSACMAFGIQAGKPIAELAIQYDTPTLFQNSPVFIVIFAGGFTSNLLWCVYLNVKNGTISDYFDGSTPILVNYIFSALAGITWYFQFMFYGMGSSQMGQYDFASWSIHFAFVIFFSNMWGLLTQEWKGSGKRTMRIIYMGLFILVLSACIIGYGNYLAGAE